MIPMSSGVEERDEMETVSVGLRDAAQSLGISVWTVRKYVAQKRIGFTKVGRRVVIPMPELRRVAEEGLRNAA